MKNEKLLIIIGVCLMLTFLIWTFFTVFDFENKPAINTLKVTDSDVEKIYQSIKDDKYLSRYTVYSGFKTAYDKLSYDYVATTAYYKLLEKQKLINDLSMTDLQEAGIAINTREVSPLAKVSLDVFNDQIKELFGDDIEIENTSFKITNRINGCLSKDQKEIYIYEENVGETEYFMQRTMDSYATRDNGNTLIIYDYFIKCQSENETCYNDDRMAMPNHYVKFSNNALTSTSVKNQAKYMHTFKWKDDHYYWVSSEIIEN